MYIDERALGTKSTRDKYRIRLLKSSAIMVSGISTKFLPENPNELCDMLKLLLQEKEAGNNSDIFIEGSFAIAKDLLEHKIISTKQHKFLLQNYLN